MISLSRARSFGGGNLGAGKVVRCVYADEAGTSPGEPHAVVCGVFVHGDQQLIPIEDHLEALVEKHIPKPDREGFVFHATDIFSGADYFADRDVWPWEKRWSILEDLADIPAKFELPITFGVVDKSNLSFEGAYESFSAKDKVLGVHAVTFALFTLAVEEAMRNLWPDEAAFIVAEDCQRMRNIIRQTHAVFRNRDALQRIGLENELFPLQRVRDTVHFADKPQSRHLQLADFCAFVVRGRFRNHPRTVELFRKIKPWLLVLPKGEPQYPQVEARWPNGPIYFPGS